MTKNDYYYAYSDYIERECQEKDVRKKRQDFVHYFTDHWEVKNEAGVTPIDFAEEAIAALGLKRKLVR